MYTGRLDLPLQPPDPSLVWVTSGLAFMYLSTVATLTVGFFVDRLEQVMDNDRGLVDELRKANDKLAEENRERKQAQERLKRSDRRLRDLAEELEARVAGRTKALETANRQLQHEVAERRQAEGVIRSSQQSLRRLYHRLQQAREEERLRIAREVHDELGQNLTALRIDLAWLERRWAGDGAPVQEKLQSMARTVDESLLGIRRITTELRPGVLDALGLCPAVEWLLKDFGKRTGIDCTADIEPEDIDLDLGRRTAAFRILQEALTNVARHARATRVRVTLRQEGGRLQLKIVDNGIGISDELANSPAAIGICGIRERINEYGGDTRIQGRAGAGTEIAVSIPLG
jgi:signal transduction histidine kinase